MELFGLYNPGCMVSALRSSERNLFVAATNISKTWFTIAGSGGC